MAKERGNSEIATCFAGYGGVARKIQDASYVDRTPSAPATLRLPSRGQADYVAILPRGERAALGLAIEAKADLGKESITFSAIKPWQRDWLSEHLLIAWIWVWMGSGRAPAGRSAYLAPWQVWLRLENNFRAEGLDGAAWKIPHKLEHRELGLSVDQFLHDYRLSWEARRWTFPKEHLVWTL